MSTSHNEIMYNLLEYMVKRVYMRLKELREENHLTQQMVADFLHIKQNTYSQYENGLRQIPIESIVMLAKYYETSTDYILELTDVETPYPKT